MSRKRSGGRSGNGFRRTLGDGLHQRSRFHAVALGMSHAELIRRSVDNFIRQPDPAQAALNRQSAALDRVVARHIPWDDGSGRVSPAVACAIGEEE